MKGVMAVYWSYYGNWISTLRGGENDSRGSALVSDYAATAAAIGERVIPEE